MSEVLDFTKSQARDSIWGDLEGFDVVLDTLVDTTRWSEIHDVVIKRTSDGKFFTDSYSVGATEMQDESPWEYSEPNFVECVPVEKTVIIYEKVK